MEALTHHPYDHSQVFSIRHMIKRKEETQTSPINKNKKRNNNDQEKKV